MTDFDISREAGLKPSYLAMTKCNNRPKYDLLKQVGIEGYKDLVFSIILIIFIFITISIAMILKD